MADAPTPAEQIAVVKHAINDDTVEYEHFKAAMRAVCATLEAQPAKDAVIKAARELSETNRAQGAADRAGRAGGLMYHGRWYTTADPGLQRAVEKLIYALAALPPVPDKEG